MKASDKLLSLDNRELRVTKDCSGNVVVSYPDCSVKDGMFLTYDPGRGDTFESACEDYYNKISGHTIVFDAHTKDRKEVQVL